MTKHTMILPSGNGIAYWNHNDDKKRTLILVHGFTGSHNGFQYIVPLLSDFRLIIPDLPGFGVSPLPHEKLTLSHLGELLVEFIQSLHLEEPPYLLGHSMGSLVVAEAVRHDPTIAAKKLILASPVPLPVGIADLRRAGAVISQFYYVASHHLPVVGGKLARSRTLTRASTALIMTTRDKELRQRIHQHHFDNLDFISSVGWYSRLYRQINRTGVSRYRQALQPFDVLIINGNRDGVTPLGKQKKLAKLIGAELEIIPGTGHLSHYEKPDELAKAMKNFLE